MLQNLEPLGHIRGARTGTLSLATDEVGRRQARAYYCRPPAPSRRGPAPANQLRNDTAITNEIDGGIAAGFWI